MINQYFPENRDDIYTLRTHLESINQKMQIYEEENKGEEDRFSDARSDAGSITIGEIKKRIKVIKNDPDFSEELTLLTNYQEFMSEESKLKKEIKNAEKVLDESLLFKYRHLTESEIKQLVVEDKWLTSIEALVEEEMERISEILTGRIQDISDRYETPLPILVENVQMLENKVNDHLVKMGYKW